MSRDYGSREQQRTTSHASSSPVAQRDVPERTPAERASDRIVEITRDVDGLAPTITALTHATAANDPRAWSTARGDLDRKLASAQRALEAAKRSASDADPAARDRLAAAEAALAERTAQATAFVEAPRGWSPVSREAQILAVLAAPATGSLKDAYDQKEASLDTEFKQLSAAESRQLAARLQAHGKDDEIAADFARLEPKRQRRLLAVLGGAARREVVARANTTAPEPDVETKPAEVHAAPVQHPAEAHAPIVAAPAPTIDAEAALDVMIAAGAPDSEVLARFDGTTLRELARKLRGARAGQGFPLGLRFNQLAHAVREQFLTALEAVGNAPRETNRLEAAQLQSHVAAAAPVAVPDALRLQPGVTPAESPVAEAAPVTASLDIVSRGLSIVSNDLRHAIAARVAMMDWPTLARFPRLELDGRTLDAALVAPLLAALGDFEAKRLASLLHPQDLGATLAPYLTKDPKQLPPVVGTLVAQTIHGVLGMSVPRMAQRMVDVADAMYAANPSSAPRVEREQLITSHPMDCVVADALIATRVTVAPDADILSGKHKAPRVGLRDVQLEWLTGAQWNVIRAKPADATPEEVMAKLYNYARHDKDAPGGPTSYYAYGVAAAAPYFSLPASWAIQFPEAKANAPAAIRDGKLPDTATDTIEARLAALATSNVGDELAFREATATAHPLPRATVQRTLDEIFVQLDHLRGVFAPWGLSGPVIAEGVHVATLSGDLGKATPDRLATLGAIFDTQRDRLHSVADTMASLSRVVATIGPRAYNPSDPLHKIAATLANAAGSSHLGQTSAYLIAQAEAEQRAVTLRSLQSSETALEQAQMSEQLVATGGGTARQNSPAVGRTQDQLQQLENSLIGGGNVSPDQIERAQLSAQELTLTMRAHALQAQIDQLEVAWRKGKVGLIATVVTTQKYRDIGPVGLVILQALGEVRKAFKPVEVAPEGQRENLASDLAGRRAAITAAQAAFDKLAKDRDLEHFFNDAYHTVRNQQIRTMIVQAAVMVGIAIASAGVGGMVAEGLGEAYMAAEGAELAELSFGARTAVQVGSMATEVVGNAAGQTVTSNTPFARALVDNAAFVLGAAGGAKMLEGILQNAPAAAAFSKALDKQLAMLASAEERSALAMRELAKTGVADAGMWAVKQGVAITGHTVMGMAIGYVVERVHEHGNEQASSAQLSDWLVQGASVAVGRMFHAALGERMPNYARLAKQSGLRRGNELYQQALAAQARAAALGAHSDPSATLAVMNDAIRLHELSLEVLDEASQIKLGKGGPTHDQIEALKADAKGQLDTMRSGEMLELRWKLHGLDSLGGGVWGGAADRVKAAVDDALSLGLPIHEKSGRALDGTQQWAIDGQQLELRVVGDSRPRPTNDSQGGSAEVLATFASPPVLGTIEHVTGVAKGPAYEKDMAELRSFYADMEREGQQGAPKKGVARDGAYGWEYGHKAFTFSHGIATFEVKIHLDDSNVSKSDIDAVKSRVHAGMDAYYNTPKHTIVGADGVQRAMHVEAIFVEDPSIADIRVMVHPGNGRANVNNWYVEGKTTTHAHEVAHGGFGIKDEYHDPTGYAPDRATPASPGVRSDDSIMADYFLPNSTEVNPAASFKQRHLDEIGQQTAPAPSKSVNSQELGKAPQGPASIREVAQKLSTIAVSRLPAGTKVEGTESVLDRDTYYVTREDGQSMLDSLVSLADKGVQTRAFRKGFIIRRGPDEWYFEFHENSTKHGAVATSEERDHHGLPSPNVATVELWGFRGVRTINGRPRSEWTAEEKREVEEVKNQDPLLYAGHVGISVDGGKTIVGFTPEYSGEMDVPTFLKSLFEHNAFPGIVGDDTRVFERARSRAAKSGWNTEPISVVELIDKPEKLRVASQVASMSGMKAGEHGLGYSFPMTAPADGEHFAPSNGYGADQVRNCATFPEKVGVKIPERSGNLGAYLPELEKWATEDAPKDFRTKGKE